MVEKLLGLSWPGNRAQHPCSESRKGFPEGLPVVLGKVPRCWLLPLRWVLSLGSPRYHLGLTLLWAGLLAGVSWSKR